MSLFAETNIQGDLYGPNSKEGRFPSRLSRAEMQKFSKELPRNIKDGLLNRMLRDDELPESVEPRHPGGVDVI